MLAQVALVVSPDLENDGIFDPRLDEDNRLLKWRALKQHLNDHGVAIATLGTFDRAGRQPDLYFLVNLDRRSLSVLLRRRVPRHRRMIWATETRIVLSDLLPRRRLMWQFLDLFPGFFPVVLTYEPKLLARGNGRLSMMPQPFFPAYREYCERPKSRFATMVVGNKHSRSPGQVYSIRRRIIRFFERRDPAAFDLYGVGWNQPVTVLERLVPGARFTTPLYRGACAAKLPVLADYQFTFAPDNQRYANYIDEKLFDALFAGSIPIYYGCPNVSEFVPPDCFVDLARFRSLGALYEALREIAAGPRGAAMRECGWEYLNGPRFAPFRVETFCTTVRESIFEVLQSCPR